MVDYVVPAPQVVPFENRPSTDTPLTAEWLNHVDALLADLATALTGRVPVLEVAASAEGIRDTIAAALVEGTGIDITVDDGNNTITIAATATEELIRDTIATALTAGSGITVTPNDGADTITIAATGGGYTDEQVRDVVGVALVAGSGIGIAVNDGADSISISANEPYNFVAADHGYVGWSCDTQLAGSSTAPTAAGVMHLIKVKLPVAATIASVSLRITNTASGLANSFVALYDSSGTRRAVTADQSTPWQTSGAKSISFVSPYAAAAGVYYVGILVGTASVLPTFSRSSNSNVVNDGLTAAQGFRASAHATTGLSATPSSLTLSTQTTAGTNDTCHYFVALND